jgi:hypothetical protein
MIQQFLARRAGVRADVVKMVPLALALHATQGLMLVALACIAAMTWGYAGYRLFLGEPYAAIVAVVLGTTGGVFIYCVDRSLTISLDKKQLRSWSAQLQIAARLVLAGVLAWTMSMPAILRFSHSILARFLFSQYQTMLSEQIERNTMYVRLPEQDATIGTLEHTVADLERRLSTGADTADYKRGLATLTEATGRSEEVSRVNSRNIGVARQQINALRSTQRSPLEIDPRVKVYEQRIAVWSSQIREAREAREQAKADEAGIFERWQSDLQTQLKLRRGELEPARSARGRSAEQMNAGNAADKQQIQSMLAPNLAQEYSAFLRVTSDPKHPDGPALRAWAFAFHLLFFLLEVMPLVLKIFMPRNSVDEVTDAVVAEEQDRINLEFNSRMRRREAIDEALLELEMQAIENVKNEELMKADINMQDVRKRLAEVVAA